MDESARVDDERSSNVDAWLSVELRFTELVDGDVVMGGGVVLVVLSVTEAALGSVGKLPVTHRSKKYAIPGTSSSRSLMLEAI